MLLEAEDEVEQLELDVLLERAAPDQMHVQEAEASVPELVQERLVGEVLVEDELEEESLQACADAVHFGDQMPGPPAGA